MGLLPKPGGMITAGEAMFEKRDPLSTSRRCVASGARIAMIFRSR
jgi:ABC-type microcin C transport system duplicated ATPase subunit YejF